MSQMSYTLDQRYSLESGLVVLSGIQALVRLPLEQRRLDTAAGASTGGFISGYRGSPLGGLDQALWAQRPQLDELGIRFQPGVNEELAATAVWGSQQVGLFPGARVAGVFGLWYGKAPGLDRACDALRHANQAGTSPLGGALLVTGDDHSAKSSSLATMSELTLKDLGVPILNPASVQDVLDFGLFGWALSRYCGSWAGLIALADTMDSAATVAVGAGRHRFVLPDGGPLDVHIRLDDDPLSQERRLHEIKLPAAARFAASNGINRTIGSRRARVGLVATGKVYLDLRQALAEMGYVSDADLAAAGIAILKLGMTWPLVESEIRDFARRADQLVVVEAKRPFVEAEIRNLLYGTAGAPPVLGKRDASGARLLPETGEVAIPDIVRVLGRFLPGAQAYLEVVERSRERLASVTALAKKDRLPLFCAGCPHNTSTRVPEGSRANAGIGCHYMAQWMDRSTQTVTQMGGEGANWVGQAPFTDETHIFANLGDGTYFHSGLLAIRQAVAARVSVTYKVLFNDAVAMTGGQPIDGDLTVAGVVAGVRAEGVAHVVVVSDAPDVHRGLGVPVYHRDDLDRVQRELRDIAGCSVLIYVQTCATELRRRRKRGTAPAATSRVVINEAVCEGCGDCSVMSSCVAVEPVETELGVKRAINQTACNVDLSCVKGFCPSFVEVENAVIARRPGVQADLDELRASTPQPEPRSGGDANVSRILITGVGGTGIVTVSALLATAAHLDGKTARTLDMTGLAQKGGAVFGHVQIADDPERLFTPRISDARADVLLACDIVSAAARDALELLDAQRTDVVANAHIAPTADFVLHQHSDVQAQQRLRRLRNNSRSLRVVDSIGLTEELLGDTACANVFMLGYAFQEGGIPLTVAALERAIELNGVAVQANLTAFHYGRLASHDPHELPTRARQRNSRALHPKQTRSLGALVAHRSQLLTQYQNAALGRRFEAFVDRVSAAERRVKPGSEALARAVAENYARLLACKDEYEVARLISDPAWRRQLDAQFEPGFRLKFWLAPPMLGTVKRRFGAWILPVMSVLARFKWLRATPFDPFRYLPERRQERALITWYEGLVDEVLDRLDRQNLPAAASLLSLPSEMRGYGHVKAAAVERARERERELRETLDAPANAIRMFDPGSRAA